MGLDLFVGNLLSDPSRGVPPLPLPRRSPPNLFVVNPPPSLFVVDPSPEESLDAVAVCPGSFCVICWLRAIGG